MYKSCYLRSLSLVSVLIFSATLYLQFFYHALPCPLCIIQRYCILLSACFILMTSFQQHFCKRMLGYLVSLLTLLSGMAVTIYHLYTLTFPSLSCGFDKLQPIVDRLYPAQWFPSIFKTMGLCMASSHPFFGLSLPAWSLIAFLLITLLLVKQGFKEIKASQR